MNKDNSISVQEIRKNPLGFLRQIKKGGKITVIYHSKPFATVMSAAGHSQNRTKSTNRMLEYAELARKSAKTKLDPNKGYKELYGGDMAKKYGLS